MSVANELERLMLDLINAERALVGASPLQLELRLNDSSEDHSQWIIDTDTFSHTGAGGSSPRDRMEAAGFQFSGSWSWGENVAWQSERGAAGYEDDVVNLHNSLMGSSGHRANILNPNFDYIGIGIEIGDYRGYEAVTVTQNFARTGAPVQIDDGADDDPVPSDDGGSAPIDQTGTSGNDSLTGDERSNEIRGAGGHDTVSGAEGDDSLFGGGGDDVVNGGHGKDTLFGGSGDDTLTGGNSNDVIKGGSDSDILRGHGGNDTLRGGSENDRLEGGNGNDLVKGEAGNDTLFGGLKNDRLKGGNGNDTLNGGSGDDTMTGNAGNDVFVFSTGHDRITDLSDGDRIDLGPASGIVSFADLTGGGHVSQSADGAMISDGAGNDLLLIGVDAADLTSSDFIF